MSESSFPFGNDAEPVQVEDEASDSRKPLLVVGGVVAALVLGAGSFLLLGGGGDEEDFAAPVPRSQAPVPAAEPQAVAVIPAASTEAVGRNPFKARYVAPVAAPAAEGGEGEPGQGGTEPGAEPGTGTGTGGSLDPFPFNPVTLPSQQPGGGGVVVQPGPSKPVQQAPAEYPITLKGVEPIGTIGISYTWTIEGKDYVVTEAQRFGKYGELTVLGFEASAELPPRAVLQVGDAPPIRVNIGETVKVL